MMKFCDIGLAEQLMKGIEDAAFTECLPVQEQTYTYALQGRDLMVQSQTGSGKTAAFLVPIFQLFTDERFAKPRRALIVAPTRELAAQITDEAMILGGHLPFRIGCFYGGVGYDMQEKLIRKGIDIIVGTPGRLIDLNHSRRLGFEDIGILVIDEADRLFDMGFLPDLRRILSRMPAAHLRQTMLFSATLSGRVQDLATEYMNAPVSVSVEPEHVTVDTVTQKLFHVDRSEKMNLLLGLLQKENPSTALIFTNMKITAEKVAQRLAYNGFGCEYIIGDLPQHKRLKIISDMKSGKIRVLVATDVAARGLHIDDLDLVINYDLPEDPEAYVHRIGRTARAGKTGKAITIVCDRYVYGLEAVESLINMKIDVEWATDEDYAEDASAAIRFKKRWKAGVPAKEAQRPRHNAVAHGKPGADSAGRSRGRNSGAPYAGSSTKKKRKRHAPETGRSDQPGGSVSPRRTENSKKGKNTIGKPPVSDRLEYYRKKYGDTFRAKPEDKNPTVKVKQSFFGIIKKLISQKKRDAL